MLNDNMEIQRAKSRLWEARQENSLVSSTEQFKEKKITLCGSFDLDLSKPFKTL